MTSRCDSCDVSTKGSWGPFFVCEATTTEVPRFWVWVIGTADVMAGRSRWPQWNTEAPSTGGIGSNRDRQRPVPLLCKDRHAEPSGRGHTTMIDSYPVLDQLLGYQLARASIPPFSLFEKAIGRPLRLSRIEFTLLVMLAAEKTLTQSAACEKLNMSAPNVSVMVDRMEKRGLLSRMRREQDRRQLHLQLTNEGVALEKKASAIAWKYERDFLSIFTEGEKETLFELLGRIAS